MVCSLRAARCRFLLLLAAVLCSGLSTAIVSAPNNAYGDGGCLLSREQHPWARFPAGSWKEVRIRREIFDADGNVTAVTVADSTSTLTEATPNAYTLNFETSLEIGGRRIDSKPQVIHQTLPPGMPQLEVREVGEGSVKIDGVDVPAQVREVINTQNNIRQVSTVYYSTDQDPPILKRVTKLSRDDSPATQVSVEVTRMGRFLPILARNRKTSQVRTVCRTAKGVVTTTETHCRDVPGGVVAHVSEERNLQGDLIARSTLELVEFGVGDGQPRRGLFERMRERRAIRRAELDAASPE